MSIHPNLAYFKLYLTYLGRDPTNKRRSAASLLVQCGLDHGQRYTVPV